MKVVQELIEEPEDIEHQLSWVAAMVSSLAKLDRGYREGFEIY